MKMFIHGRLLSSTFALAAAASFPQTELSAQTWTTVDTLQYALGHSAGAHSLTADAFGNVYATGWGTDNFGIDHGLVMVGADAGATWTTAQDFSNARYYDICLAGPATLLTVGVTATGPTWLARKGLSNGLSWNWSTADSFLPKGFSLTSANGVAVDGSGNIFVAGFGYQPAKRGSVNSFWFVRKSSNTGQTWSTVDNFQYNGQSSSAHAIVSTTAGVFAAGTGNGHWLVRQSADAGVHWSVVDDFQYNAGASANWLAVDNIGNLYVVGNGNVAGQNTSSEHWLVRKGVNSGGGWVWSTVDDFQYASAMNSFAAKAGIDGLGNLYVVGYGADSNGSLRWITRKYSDGAWATVDDFQYLGGEISQGLGFARDSAGNLYTGGLGRDSANVGHWLVRKATP